MTESDGNRSKSYNRQIESLRRERDSIRRILEQASLDGVKENVKRLTERLDRIESQIPGDSSSQTQE
jgi:prefoldin subunit 5|tara:strand:- start:81 stop:281 length:201 start_codon:yes stop_codon:yes gene_type:complete